MPQKLTFNAEKRDKEETFSYKNPSARYGCSPHRLVVQVSGGVPGAQKQRHPRLIKDKSNFFGENRVDTIFGAGLWPCSFFVASNMHEAQAYSGEDAPLNPDELYRRFDGSVPNSKVHFNEADLPTT
ncbi:MAG TPA: hypothetical protein VF499_05900 [Afipia sp.]